MSEINQKEEKNNKEQQIIQEPTPSSLRRKLIYYLSISFIMILGIFILTVPTLTTHKPAIYLYSEKPTAVSIKLDNLLIKDIVIPKYSYLNGWSVLTNKDGTITDLNPMATNCSKLPSSFGFEYAQEACKANSYPYIYWDGTPLKRLPRKLLGWSVKKENIEQFLSQKADEIEMNSAEKSEFVRYWTYTVKNYPATDFRIYFLQNQEVDDYVKLTVNPQPDSWNRIQIVITPVLPNTKSIPYELKKIKRKGLTLVEWGGVISDKI